MRLGSVISFKSAYMTPRSVSHNDTFGSEIDCSRPYSLGSDEYNLAFAGFSALALFLLLTCALLAGLTLAVCGLDITRLQVLSITGDLRQRTQALTISRIKRNASWFLCSMIICSVASAESIPIVVELLFGNDWLPIVVSTVAIAIFAELLPQYLLPRKALYWGYYCWPLIWGCMWLTCFISWPLSYLLDTVFDPQVEKGIYTLEQLDILIKFHERAEKHGGLLGPDASRIMRGAVALECQTLEGKRQLGFEEGKAPLADIEKGHAAGHDIVIPWSSVRCISINEEVTPELVLRIKNWAYSRIPVVGDPEAAGHKPADCCGDWHGQKIYGFLHIKNLVGLNFIDLEAQSKKLLVKDLPLYPLPIVCKDLPLYDLLNVFQLGIARIAVVIPKLTKDRLVPLNASLNNLDTLPRHAAPLWTASAGLNARTVFETIALDAHIDWTADLLKAAQNDIELLRYRRQSVIGIRCPEPIGIVTYADIIDALLQKASLDEKNFFDGDHVTKIGEEENVNGFLNNHSMEEMKTAVPSYATQSHVTYGRSEENNVILGHRIISGPDKGRSGKDNGTLRRRNTAGLDNEIDGYSKCCEQGFDGAYESDARLRLDQIDHPSSYTENSLGGFHGHSGSIDFIQGFEIPLSDEKFASKVLPTTLCLPPALHLAVEGADGEPSNKATPISSNSCYTTPEFLPKLRRVTPFSRQNPNSAPAQSNIAESIISSNSQKNEVPPREQNFHDDRILLPSQRERKHKISQSDRGQTGPWF